MPFERRDILFTLPEVRDALLMTEAAFKSLPMTPEMRFIEALHTRENDRQFHVIRERYTNIYMSCLGKSGVMIRAGTLDRHGIDQVDEFFVPDDIMEKALLMACANGNIILPRAPQKRIITEDLLVGFQFTMTTSGMVLENM